jgi:hypothetical protein
MNLGDFNKLKKLMMLTTSENDVEALAALRKANSLLKAASVTWDRVFARTVTVVNEFEAGIDDGDYTGERKRNDHA